MVNLNPQGNEITGKISKVVETTLLEILGGNVETSEKDGQPYYKLVMATPKLQSFLDAIKRYPDSVKTAEQREQHRLSRVARQGLAIYYKLPESSERYEFVIIPKLTGWTNSNLKKVMDKNKLPNDTATWAGKDILIKINADGYPELSV